MKELKKLDAGELRSLCIRENWFTCGDNRQYSRMFEMNDSGASVDELALVISFCSKDVSVEEVKGKLLEEMGQTYYEVEAFITVKAKYQIKASSAERAEEIALEWLAQEDLNEFERVKDWSVTI